MVSIVYDPHRLRRDLFRRYLCLVQLGHHLPGLRTDLGPSGSAREVHVSYDTTVRTGETEADIISDDGGSAQRFGVFIIALAFALAQLGTNIAANSISAGTDFTALLPRFINIRRGGYLCAAIGLALCPYQFLSTSNNFETYLSAYSVFLSSIAGVMVSDYYFVRRGYLGVKELYDPRRSSPYYFTFGINWRAYAGYIAGILINVVGFVGAVNGGKVPIGATVSYPLCYSILSGEQRFLAGWASTLNPHLFQSLNDY